MPGQFKTRQNPDTGRLEKIPEAEQGALRAAAEGIAAPPPAAGSVTQQDVDFVNAGAEPPPLPDAQPGATPPPLPPQAPPVQPPPLPQQADQDFVGQGAAAGGSAGGLLGPAGAAAGAAIGAGAGFVASQAFKKAPIGSLEGSGQTGGGDQEVLRQLLQVQRGIAQVGSPIKNAITTTSAGARL